MGRLTGFDDAALKEQFSLTYIRAVAYAAGAVVEELTVDRDSIDVVIRARGQVGAKRSPSVEAQLRRCGYWKHLGGEPPVANEQKVRVKLTQTFSPDALVGIFHDVTSGRIQ